MTGRFERIVRAAAARPGRVLAIAAVVAVLGALASLGLKPTAATDTLVGRGTDDYQATQRYHDRFGDDAVLILVRGSLPNIVLTQNLSRLLGLEGCIAGNKPANVKAPGGDKGACAAFAKTKPVQVVYGPGTFINSAVNEIQTQLSSQIRTTQQQAQQAATAARKVAKARGATKAQQDQYAKQASDLVNAQFQKNLLNLAVRYGLSTSAATPQINNPDFVYSLVFDPIRGATTPKSRFAYLFPNAHSALIQVRLKPGLDDHE